MLSGIRSIIVRSSMSAISERPVKPSVPTATLSEINVRPTIIRWNPVMMAAAAFVIVVIKESLIIRRVLAPGVRKMNAGVTGGCNIPRNPVVIIKPAEAIATPAHQKPAPETAAMIPVRICADEAARVPAVTVIVPRLRLNKKIPFVRKGIFLAVGRFNMNDNAAVFYPILRDRFAKRVAVGIFGRDIIQAGRTQSDAVYAAAFQKTGNRCGAGG